MGLFSKKDKQNNMPQASQPQATPGAPRSPMGPNMAPPPGAPRPPMGPNMAPPPGAPRPPMGPGTPPGAPKPPMGPNMASPSPNAPRPPMGPGTPPGAPKPFGFGPQPMSKPPVAGGFGPSAPTPQPSFSMPESNFGSSVTNLDGILVSKKGYVAPRSIRAGGKCTYDEFCSELTYDFLDNLLKSQNMMEHKQLINKIKKTLIFALTNTKDLPEGEREILFTATIRFIDFLKGVVYYPEKDVMNEDVITYIPFLKDTAYAFRSFLLKNR